MNLSYSHHTQSQQQRQQQEASSRVFIPRDWRDNLARAINERDLARIEHLIEVGQQHNHTKFNDPLIADAAFLLQLAQENSQHRFAVDAMSEGNIARHGSVGRRFLNRTPKATRSKLADDSKGGSMSWVAPPLVSLVSGPLHQNNNQNNSSFNNNHHQQQKSVYGSRSVSVSFAGNNNNNNNPLGNTASLREKVSQLREMALFPDSTVSSMYDNNNNNSQSQQFNSSHHHRTATTSAYINPNNSISMNLNGGGAGSSSLINQHQMLLRRSTNGAYNSGYTSRSITDDAAAAMGVPSIWIDRPIGLNWEPTTTTSTTNNNHLMNNNSSPSPSRKSNTFYPYSGETGESSNASPIRSVFEDPSITGAALRLHSFVHAEEEPAIKSSRLYQAYVAMDRLAPKESSPNNQSAVVSSSSPQQQNDNSNNNTRGVDISVSPARESSVGTAARGFPSQDFQNSPEHHRLIRKLNHESQAPTGVEVTRMLRFLAATESMNRGALEQEAEGMLRSNVANHRYGLLHSRGVSSDRSAHEHRSHVFLDN